MRYLYKNKNIITFSIFFVCIFIYYFFTDIKIGYAIRINHKNIGIVESSHKGYAYIKNLEKALANELEYARIYPCFTDAVSYANEQALDDNLSESLGIDIKMRQETIYIPFSTETVDDPSLYIGTEKVIEGGAMGEKIVSLKETAINGKTKTLAFITETMITPPTTRKIAKGTKPLPNGIGTGTFSYPLASITVSSSFGERWGKQHEGIDFAADNGEDIFAADNGIVTCSQFVNGYGNLVILDHNNGFLSYYAHCSQLYVANGQTVVKGEKIAAVGSTGNSTGPHLHFEIHKDGIPQNPTAFLPT